MNERNQWCEILGIDLPDLEEVKDRRSAKTYSRLIVALLERGEAMTLEEVARRFEEAGVDTYESSLRSLKRCRPARAPIYRDGDHYSLDPYDDELNLWVFRLGLRPPQMPRLEVVPPPRPQGPLPGDEVSLSREELEEAWRNASLRTWSTQRMALAVLDTEDGKALAPQEVVDIVAGLTPYQSMCDDSKKFQRRGCPIEVGEDGLWRISEAGIEGLPAMRRAVRKLIKKVRNRQTPRRDPAVQRAYQKRYEQRRAAKARALAQMSRVLVMGFPTSRPRVVTLLDVGERTIETFIDEPSQILAERVLSYDIIAAQDVRPLLGAMGIDGQGKRLAELRPPQKTMTVNEAGKTLKLTNELIIKSSCGIARPFGDPEKMQAYLEEENWSRLQQRLERDIKALFALYEYGRLHGRVRVQWRAMDVTIPISWVHREEPTLYHLMEEAQEKDQPMEVVLGAAPDWDDPWSGSQVVIVLPDPYQWGNCLVDADGVAVEEMDIQRARVI